jgi:hypothetical protein
MNFLGLHIIFVGTELKFLINGNGILSWILFLSMVIVFIGGDCLSGRRFCSSVESLSGIGGNFRDADEDSLIKFAHLNLSHWKLSFGTSNRFIVCNDRILYYNK